MKRKLSAILFADVVGYSGYMRQNEILAIRSVRHHLNEISVVIQQYGGRRRGGAGDSVLATFPSAQAAILCATQIQSREGTCAELFDMKFRVGIHLGDATEMDGQLHGDSVNVAARLEPLAMPGGICASISVRDALRGLPNMNFSSIGHPNLKNLGDDMEVFSLDGFGEASNPVADSTEGKSAAQLSDNFVPTVAVLPFATNSVREDLAALADGFAEEIISFLTRFRALDVIAPGSSILGRSADLDEIPSELGVRYTVGGSVQLSERRIRVKVRLFDTARRHALWSESYDRVFDDIFDIQEEIAECVAASMAVHIEEAEQMLARARPPDSLGAYALQLRARDEIFWNEPQARERGMELILRSIQVSDRYARAYAVLARAHHLGWKYSWSDDPQKSFREADAAALRAIEVDRSDARGQAEVGLVALYQRDHNRSLAALSKALQLNPSDADIIGEYADTLKHAGQSEKALPLFNRAIKLNPLHADRYRRDLAHAHLVRRDFESAIETVYGMTDPHQALRVLTASYAHLGRIEEARHWAGILREKYPGFSARGWAHIVPDRNPEDTEMFVEGLERAGL